MKEALQPHDVRAVGAALQKGDVVGRPPRDRRVRAHRDVVLDDVQLREAVDEDEQGSAAAKGWPAGGMHRVAKEGAAANC